MTYVVSLIVQTNSRGHLSDNLMQPQGEDVSVCM